MSYLNLTNNNRSCGYTRSLIRSDVLYGYCKMRDLSITVSRKDMTVTRINDDIADEMLGEGLITKQQFDAYLQTLTDGIYHFDKFDGYSSEKLYNYIADIRKTALGKAVDKYLVNLAKVNTVFYIPIE